jgi:hypothetical protein
MPAPIISQRQLIARAVGLMFNNVKKMSTLAAMHEQTAWRPLEVNSKTGAWTDDFSNVASIVHWK